VLLMMHPWALLGEAQTVIRMLPVVAKATHF